MKRTNAVGKTTLIDLLNAGLPQTFILLKNKITSTKLKLQYFGHLMQRTDSLEKTLMLGKFEGGRIRG